MLIEDFGIPPGVFGNVRFLDSSRRGSRVYSAEENGRVVAVKVIDIDSNREELAEVEREVKTLRMLRHAHVAAIIRAFVNGRSLLIVQKLCSSLSLHRLLRGGFPDGLPELAVAFVVRDCLIGLSYLHSCGLVHRALNAAHLLCDERGRISITGLRHSITVRKQRCFDFPSRHALQNLSWLAPEILAQDLRGYDRSSDIYSVGILSLELANGSAPFAGLESEKVLVYKMREVVPSLTNSDCFKYCFEQFTVCCMLYEPKERPTCTQLLRHAFLKQVKKYSSLWRFINPPKDIKNIQEAKQSPMREVFEMELCDNKDFQKESTAPVCQWSWETQEKVEGE